MSSGPVQGAFKCLSVPTDYKLMQRDTEEEMFKSYTYCKMTATSKSQDIVHHHKLKYVKDISWVGKISFVHLVCNVPAAALDML